MKIQAVIFDVYSTLLEVGPAPLDAEARWQKLFQATFNGPARWSRLEFSAACSQVIARRHAWARARGIPWPEINWPAVVVELIPELAGVSPAERDGFIHGHIQTGRTLEMSTEAATVLAWLRQRGARLGIASNSQAYTLTELEEALRSHDLHLGLFSRELCFWSFEHGFSKPDPHVFQYLTQRLEAWGVSPSSILMVGDRADNDIEPADAFGWQTWHYSPASRTSGGGTWSELLTQLQAG